MIVVVVEQIPALVDAGRAPAAALLVALGRAPVAGKPSCAPCSWQTEFRKLDLVGTVPSAK